MSPQEEQKATAILAHRSEVDRVAVPGVVAGLPPTARADLLSTERFVRRPLVS